MYKSSLQFLFHDKRPN